MKYRYILGVAAGILIGRMPDTYAIIALIGLTIAGMIVIGLRLKYEIKTKEYIIIILFLTASLFAYPPGDFNSDGKVNMKDWPLGDHCLVINNWLSHVPVFDPNDNITITANGVADDSG